MLTGALTQLLINKFRKKKKKNYTIFMGNWKSCQNINWSFSHKNFPKMVHLQMLLEYLLIFHN